MVLTQWLLTIAPSTKSCLEDVVVHVKLYRRPKNDTNFTSNMTRMLRSLRGICRKLPSIRCMIEFGRIPCLCGLHEAFRVGSEEARHFTVRVELAKLVESTQDSARQLKQEASKMEQRAGRPGKCPARGRTLAANRLDSLAVEIQRDDNLVTP